MSNGKSKIAIFKAALCCGFAIALRALFLGILRIYCHCERAQCASVAINRQGIPIRLIATRLAPLAMTRDNDVSSIQHG